MLDVRELAQLPESAEDVCSLIAQFAEQWTGRAPNDPAASAEIERELAAAEQHLDESIPTALRWLYTAYGTSNTLIGTQDRLLAPAELAADADRVVTVCEENQKCAEWGYRSTTDEGEGNDDRPTDPPVLWKDLQGLTDQGGQWQSYQPRLSTYLLEAVFSEAMVAEGALTAHRELDPSAVIDLPGAVPLALHRHVFWADPSAAPVAWFALEDVLIRNDGGTWLWALGKNEEALQRLERELPGPWERLES